MPSFLIRVLNNTVPVAGAEVRIYGVGVDDTDSRGIASIPIPAGKLTCSRGTRYATRKAKLAGEVTDEPMPYRVQIVYLGGAAGPVLVLTPDVETTYDVARI